ncbi:MAG: tRNA 2-selenouridine synthase [Syntrophomonadaceae bacterium]|nr:tRNA 2-selenouridine synthase [Bacillota bacterium]
MLAKGRIGRLKSLLTVEKLLQNRDGYCLVDVRSPGEFFEARIPGAVNMPLFEDEERMKLGATYWQEGTEQAKLLGLSLVAPRLPQLVEKILALAAGREIVLYCWRGGMRSGSLLSVMEVMGYPVWQLQGGYKAFRRQVVSYLSNVNIQVPVFVLNGLTGVGKTLLLRELASCGAPVLNLEEMANHRGSVFGAIGLGASRSQKDFESLLFLALCDLQGASYLLVEGEGKKIGPVVLPDFLYQAMREGHHLLLEAEIELRVERILKEYAGMTDNRQALAAAVLVLQKKLGREKCELLIAKISQGDYRTVARTLCTDYYDLYYRDSRGKKGDYLAVINLSDIERGALSVLTYCQERVIHKMDSNEAGR